MTNISELANELKDATRWQKTPLPLSDNDYVSIIIRALKRLYIDTGRASVFNMDMITKTMTKMFASLKICQLTKKNTYCSVRRSDSSIRLKQT